MLRSSSELFHTNLFALNWVNTGQPVLCEIDG
jgi:hypothetical protein